MKAWQKALRRLEGAYSDHTIRSYDNDFSNFADWCRRKRLPFLPAAPSTVQAYVKEAGERLKPNSIRKYLCAIRRIHQLCDEVDGTLDEEVQLEMRRVRRAQPSRPAQAHGITAAMRDRLLEACGADLTGLRDKVLVSVGFDTLCRRGELVALSVEDLTPTEDGRYTVLVRRAKNDAEGAGRTARLSLRTSIIVREWIAQAEISRGAVLRPVFRSTVRATYLQPLTVSRVLKRLTRAAEDGEALEKRVSGHSLRVGAAQQLTLNGYGLPQIMRAGGWKSPNVVARYIENVDLDVWNEN